MDESEFMRRLREAFAVEADDHLQSMSSGLIEIEKTENPVRRKELVEAIFREAHSLKGAARAVSRNDIESVCQAMESIFAQWKREGASTEPEVFDTLNRAIDFMAGLRARAAPSASGDGFKAVQQMVRTIANLGVPAAPQRTPSKPTAPSSAGPQTGSPARGQTSSAAHIRRVLVVDDSVTSRMLLKDILELAGYDVTTAVDGIDAGTALHSNAFDLVCSDVDMPGMNGFDLTARIRADERLAHLPVILLTALGSQQEQERGRDAGVDAFLVKNFDQSNLLEVIQRLLR